MRYLVIEIQTAADGTVGNFVWSFSDRQLAEQKYHTVLASAAVSSLPKHAAAMLSNDGILIDRRCYEHNEITE